MASAAVATQPSQQHLGAGPTSRTSSPMDNKKNNVKQQTSSAKTSPVQPKSSLPEEPQPTSLADDSKPIVQATEPLAPPPRPAPTNPAETPDYFSAVHNNGGIAEFNPFEQSFGAPSTETPGKTLLPPVASLTSPALPGTNSAGGYNWQSSLRSGPLSPAMLAGPQQGDYFDSIGRGFPTPNESSLRTGLTPGGGGSMFPAPSPNSQALFNSLQSGGATPGTLDFHRTAMNAAARNKNNQFANTSNPQETLPKNNMDAQHDATDAANGLFMLAKGGQPTNQFAVPNAVQTSAPTRNGQDQKQISENGDSPESHEDTKPARGGRGKKVKAEPANNRRKSEASAKGSNKRAKGNSGAPIVDPALEPPDEDDDSDMDMDEEEMKHPNGKKMTDEEKRRNFLERNRIAALKCRQRKKQWLANLQAKVEMYSAENDSLNTQVAQLHEEIRNLRTLLMGHKDCPVGHAQGIGQFLSGMQDPNGFANQHVNPYGMAMPNGPQMQQQMQRT
ncbi:Transcription factor [Elasticomyces elasticus]|uniref:Transcription factor n=1 Tax=Exophiala sideris TaxID=1016849 RepID=A0ABR0JSH6_9EURO|nr:Transcription factor [Elasticomyces elasticus]KAK5040528.1 Transcription factor [Exophiala sideris]KAK5043047.1 Transcription factor [Exophiala sideris]KAK5068906.1 Transcription factor [Exophiala sideris]KAK5186502.1 Transcription factor [Eurotiomycetes sp. CCFEE 6388]